MIEALILIGALTCMLMLNKTIRQSEKSKNKDDLGVFAYKTMKSEVTKKNTKVNRRA